MFCRDFLPRPQIVSHVGSYLQALIYFELNSGGSDALDARMNFHKWNLSVMASPIMIPPRKDYVCVGGD